jgi:hypothetical protein
MCWPGFGVSDDLLYGFEQFNLQSPGNGDSLYGLKKLIPSSEEAKEQAKELDKISRGSAQGTLKNLALYVDINRQGNISVPSQLENHHARREMAGLEYFLEKFALLLETLPNDERWQPLAHSIHQRLTTDRFAQ